MLLRRHTGGPRGRAANALTNALNAAALSAGSLFVITLVALLFACKGDRVVVRSDKTLTSAASQDTTTTCGNGELDLGETCDDGNTLDGDGCDATCQPEGECGDQIVGVGEECEPPGTGSCNAQCRRIAVGCGNGVLDPFEECEDNNTVGGDGCSAECLREICGNGRIDVGEECEPPGTAQCAANCRLVPPAACGNGVQEPGEECEDGNQLSGDGCSEECLVEYCGNGRIDPGETCEPPATDTCNLRCQTIPASARRGVCGNAVREANEECDDGNTLDADGCSGGCELEVCGNGRLDPGEFCEPPDTTVCDAHCVPRLERCGDRRIDGVEECDDGNALDGDGCSARCELEACGNGRLDVGEDCEPPSTAICDASCHRISRFCGNRLVEPPEECDDGNIIVGDGCNLRCELEFCGNGRLDFGEQCELPGSAVCDATCHLIGACGNGSIDIGESCDPPNATNCSAACQFIPPAPVPDVCGNGVVDGAEECDDTNTLDADGCSAACLREVCGNARIDSGEECDDGNLVSGDGCSDACRAEVCGNGRIDSVLECEPPGSPGCSATCQPITPFCGNAQIEAAEECDDGNGLDGDGCSSDCVVDVVQGAPSLDAPAAPSATDAASDSAAAAGK